MEEWIVQVGIPAVGAPEETVSVPAPIVVVHPEAKAERHAHSEADSSAQAEWLIAETDSGNGPGRIASRSQTHLPGNVIRYLGAGRSRPGKHRCRHEYRSCVLHNPASA